MAMQSKKGKFSQDLQNLGSKMGSAEFSHTANLIKFTGLQVLLNHPLISNGSKIRRAGLLFMLISAELFKYH